MMKGEKGVALLLAVSVLAALGIISLTAFTLAVAERDAGLAAVARVQARGAAEAALTTALLGWPSSQTPVALGATAPLADLSGAGAARGSAQIRALGGSVYVIQAAGVWRTAAGAELASVRLEQLVLLDPPDSNSFTRPRAYPRGWRLVP